MGTLDGNLPTDQRRPGTFHTFDGTSSARGKAVIQPRRVAIIGCKTSAGAATVLEPLQVYSETEADTQGGTGSEVALMVRWAMLVARFLVKALGGAMPEIWIVPVAAPSGGTAPTWTLTAAGTTTTAGDLIVRIDGRLIRVPLASGTASTAVDDAIKAEIDKQLAWLPVTASASGSVCTLTHNHKGVNGNALDVAVVQQVAGVTVTAATGATGAGVSDIDPAFDAMLTRRYPAVAVANHLAQDFTDAGEYADAAWAPSAKLYSHIFFGETASIGTATTLAAAQNRYEIVANSFETGRNLPGEQAAAVAVMTQMLSKPNVNFDGTELPLYGCTDSYQYLDSELETALAGGVTPLQMTPAGRVRVTRLVTTKATHNSVAFENLRDYAVSRTLAHYALQVDAAVVDAIRGRNIDAELIDDVKHTVYAVLSAGEAAGDLHNVDAHAAEITVTVHPDVPTRLVVGIPQSVVPNCHQADMTHHLFVEAPAAAAA